MSEPDPSPFRLPPLPGPRGKGGLKSPSAPPAPRACCGGKTNPPPVPAAGCCGTAAHGHGSAAPAAAGSCCSPATRRLDWLLWISLSLVAAGTLGHFTPGGPAWWLRYSHSIHTFLSMAWWGLLAGMLAVGILAQIPRELVAALLGRGGSFRGILRATLAGTLLDLCNHGVLMVGAQLYRKGASPGQTLAFLISSPWNSLSLTLILAALIGWKWMLAFVALSMLIGITSGWLADRLVAAGRLPANPNHCELPPDFRLGEAFRQAGRALRPGRENLRRMLLASLRDSRMILRWIFLGIVLAAVIQASIPAQTLATWFGPTWLGLMLTLAATTVIEVCTEGSSPIAADLMTRAKAPGNAFTFLMAGAATDYTEIMVLRETTRSWRTTLALPLLTVPQVLAIGWLLNQGS